LTKIIIPLFSPKVGVIWVWNPPFQYSWIQSCISSYNPVNVGVFLFCFVFICSLRGIGLTEEAGDDLAEILAEMPSLNLLE